MMNRMLVVSALTAFLSCSVIGQIVPGTPEDNGLTPKTGTVYINSRETVLDMVNNGNTESLGVAIANNGNVMVGWEDDGDQLTDLEAVWTLFDSGGAWLTPDTGFNSLANPSWGWLTNKFMSYFRADRSPVFGGAAWGPKIKANLFGDGMGMAGTSYGLSGEITAYAPWDDANSGDTPALQLIGNDGSPGAFLPGVSSGYAVRDPGNIRIADWDYLSNGNILVIGESRQTQDLIDIYGGDTVANHGVYRILDPSGNVVKAETLASETPVLSEMWHGAAVTKNGFALRFSTPEGVRIRLFDLAGVAVSTNIDVAAVAGNSMAGEGGRGDSAGFHGNGKDAYVLACTGTDSSDGLPKVWLTVISTNGTVRFSKSVADDLTLASVSSADAAIDADGQTIVVFGGKFDAALPSFVMGRRFDATGKPVGGTYYISEKELPDSATQDSTSPRVAWRNNLVAVAWESKNDPWTVDSVGTQVVVTALRYFSTFAPGSIESVGLTRIVPDRPMIVPNNDALGNWEPYISVLGTTTFLVEGNTFAEGFDNPDGKQRYVVALQPATGGAMKLSEGFYGDNGQPYAGEINASRQNGNPGRVAGDTRPGATSFVVGAEISPHVYDTVFGADNRWTLGFDRLVDGRYGCVQAFKLDTSTLAATPLSKALDSANGRLTSGSAAGNQITRFGGDVAFLDNGNYVSVVEDRSRVRNPDSDLVAATIFAPNGTVVKETFVVAPGDIWGNLAPCKGGFVVRARPDDTTATRVLYFYDNAGNLKGQVDQAASGLQFDTGRGDGTRLFGHINSPYVYLTGRAANTLIVKVAAFDASTQKFVAAGDVNEGAFTGNFDRASGAVDARNRLTVAWVSQPSGYTNQQVAARVLSFDGTNFTALTRSFFPFINVNATNDIRTLQMTVAMTTKQICVAAKGEINLQNKPELGAAINQNTQLPLKELNFFTVFTHPVPAEDPTPGVTPTNPVFTKAQYVPGTPSKLHLEWTGGGTLQIQDNLSGTWTDITGATSPYDLTIDRATAFLRIKQ